MALGCVATDPDEVGTLMRRAHDMTGDALDAVRRIVRDLRPRILDGIGLAGALRSLLDGFGERARIDCRFIAGGAGLVLILASPMLRKLAGDEK